MRRRYVITEEKQVEIGARLETSPSIMLVLLPQQMGAPAPAYAFKKKYF